MTSEHKKKLENCDSKPMYYNYYDYGFVIPSKYLINRFLTCKKCGCPPDSDLISLFLLSSYTNNYCFLEAYQETKKNEVKKMEQENKQKKCIKKDNVSKTFKDNTNIKVIKDNSKVNKDNNNKVNKDYNNKVNKDNYNKVIKITKVSNKKDLLNDNNNKDIVDSNKKDTVNDSNKKVSNIDSNKEDIVDIDKKDILLENNLIINDNNMNDILPENNFIIIKEDNKSLQEDICKDHEIIQENNNIEKDITNMQKKDENIIQEKDDNYNTATLLDSRINNLENSQELVEDSTLQKKVIRKSAYHTLFNQNLMNMIPHPNKTHINDSVVKRRQSSTRSLIVELDSKSTEKTSIDSNSRKYKNIHICKYCEISFFSKVKYNQHLKASHPEEFSLIDKPYKCPYDDCPKNYKNKGGMEYHLIHSHSLSRKNVEKLISKLYDE